MALKSKLKRRNPKAKNQPAVVNENLSKQNSLQNLLLVPGKRPAQQRPSPYNTLIFMDSILKGICMHEFNSLLKNRKAKMLNFPGSSSKKMLHYIDIHLEDRSFDTALFYVGVNDLLNDNSISNVDNLESNIHKIVEKCKRVGASLLYTTRLPILERVHNLDLKLLP